MWETETTTYRDRIADTQLRSAEVIKETEKFPEWPSFQPTTAGSVRYRALILANGTLATAESLLTSIQLLYSNSHFHAGAHCARLIVEQWGLLIYTQEEVIKKLRATDGETIADKRLTRLLLGSKTKTLLPAGIQEHIPVINVMDFIRAGELLLPGFAENYNFLCDISHPSHVIHSNFLWLTRDGAWKNRIFAKEAHRILERVTTILEGAIFGFQKQVISIYQECIPPLEVEITAHSN